MWMVGLSKDTPKKKPRQYFTLCTSHAFTLHRNLWTGRWTTETKIQRWWLKMVIRFPLFWTSFLLFGWRSEERKKRACYTHTPTSLINSYCNLPTRDKQLSRWCLRFYAQVKLWVCVCNFLHSKASLTSTTLQCMMAAMTIAKSL